MAFEVKTFSDIEYACREIRYYLDNGDYDRIYSNRGQVLEKSRALMEPCYIHLWIILYPLEGQEYTRPKNISDLSNWMEQILKGIQGPKLNLGDVYTSLEGGYQAHVKSNLQKHHGYSNLKGIRCEEISAKMFDIFSAVNLDMKAGRSLNNKYLTSRERLQEIITEQSGL